jgi:hypothetical protein
MKIKKWFLPVTIVLVTIISLLIIDACLVAYFGQSWKIEKTEKVQATVVQKWTQGAMIFSLHKMLRVKFSGVENDIESSDLYFKHKKGDKIELLLVTEVSRNGRGQRQRLKLPNE